MSRNERDSHVTATAGSRADRPKRPRPVETIKVRVAPTATTGATEAAIGQLVEEWASLTYACLAEDAMDIQAANEPMRPDDADVGVE